MKNAALLLRLSICGLLSACGGSVADSNGSSYEDARHKCGDGLCSANESCSTCPADCGSCGGSDTQPPTAPGNLRVTSPAPTSIAVAWDASTDNVAVSGYQTFLGGVLVGTLSATAGSATFSGLTCGTSYVLGVLASDAAGNRSTTSTINASTSACGGCSAGAFASDYFDDAGNGTHLSGAPVLSRCDSQINFDWGSGSPDPLVTSDNFSARFTGTVSTASAQAYFISVTVDDGARVYLDGTKIIESWGVDQASSTYSATPTLTAGSHALIMEYYEHLGGATAKLTVTPLSQVAGPVNTALPAISGTTQVGQVLTASSGSWMNSPNGYAYQWRRCLNMSCAPVSGATATSYALTSADLGATLQVTVTATNASGSMSAVSGFTAAVTAGQTTATRLYGYSMHTLSQSDPDTYMSLATNGGATTSRDDVSWSGIETAKGQYNWSSPDQLVTYAVQHGVRLLMMVGTSPAWASGVSTSLSNWWWYPPTNAADYGDFAGKVAARYGQNGAFWTLHPTLPKLVPAGIEIWNEPNTSGFWMSGADPVKYTAMLKSAYAAIKAADPSMPVLAGAMAPHGGYNDVDCNGVADGGQNSSGISAVNFLASIYANGAAGSFDGVSHHPYNYWSGATASGMLTYHVCSAWSQMNDTSPSLRSLMTANGDGAKKIWATELGAPTCTSGATYTCVSEAEQSNLAAMELPLWKSYSWTGNYYWYDLRDDHGGTSTTDIEQHFGVVRGDNSLKPAYATLKGAYTAP